MGRSRLWQWLVLLLLLVSTAGARADALSHGSQRDLQEQPATVSGAAAPPKRAPRARLSAKQLRDKQQREREQAKLNSQGQGASGSASSVASSDVKRSQPRKNRCSHLWRPDNLPGKCFGLKPHTEYQQLADIVVVRDVVECKALCCLLGDHCVSWQYQNSTSRCSLGPAVRVGHEGANTPNWCDPHPPGKWVGHRIKSRDTATGSYEWDEKVLSAQCFGLGSERFGSNRERLNAAQCREACGRDKDCIIWQQSRNRGCYYSTDKDVYCSEPEGAFDGGRKCIPGFCGAMFIKKDLRKVHEILVDSNDPRETLVLSKRQSEFQGECRVLFHASRIPALKNLKVLNLYDNSLTSVAGIGALGGMASISQLAAAAAAAVDGNSDAVPPDCDAAGDEVAVDSDTNLKASVTASLTELNLGNNKLSSLPFEFGALQSLTTLWLEDNEFEAFPVAVCQLHQLKTLRLSGNRLDFIPQSIGSLTKLETLALDNNEITAFPDGILQLTCLKHLWLRQNKINELPENIDELTILETLSLSSNALESLPTGVARLPNLTKLFVNGNKISSVPSELCQLTALQVLNLANNKLTSLPQVWEDKWGTYDVASGSLNQIPKGVSIVLIGNALT